LLTIDLRYDLELRALRAAHKQQIDSMRNDHTKQVESRERRLTEVERLHHASSSTFAAEMNEQVHHCIDSMNE
jgi:hypothetical protein